MQKMNGIKYYFWNDQNGIDIDPDFISMEISIKVPVIVKDVIFDILPFG